MRAVTVSDSTAKRFERIKTCRLVAARQSVKKPAQCLKALDSDDTIALTSVHADNTFGPKIAIASASTKLNSLLAGCELATIRFANKKKHYILLLALYDWDYGRVKSEKATSTLQT